MSNRLEEIEKQAASLTLQEKSALIEHLVSNLDELDEQECERLWLEEATRRYREYKAGKMPYRSAAEAFQSVRDKLGKSL